MEVTIYDDYQLITPGCGCQPFAVPTSVYKQFTNYNKHGKGPTWYCPQCGSKRYYSGENEAERLRRELEQSEQDKWEAINRANEEAGKYDKIRSRVVAGQCPCCDEKFENLAKHMRTKHPEEGFLRAIRESVGLTQAQLADEIGCSPAYISHFENQKPVPDWANDAIHSWVENL